MVNANRLFKVLRQVFSSVTSATHTTRACTCSWAVIIGVSIKAIVVVTTVDAGKITVMKTIVVAIHVAVAPSPRTVPTIATPAVVEAIAPTIPTAKSRITPTIRVYRRISPSPAWAIPTPAPTPTVVPTGTPNRVINYISCVTWTPPVIAHVNTGAKTYRIVVVKVCVSIKRVVISPIIIG